MTVSQESLAVADYLAQNLGFFQEHPALLSRLKLPSTLTGRTVSLQERQIEVLREKYRLLELRLAELSRLAQENSAIAEKFKRWVHALLLARNDVDLPHVLNVGLQTIFDVPQVSLRLWGVADEFAHTWFAQDVNEDARLFTNSLAAPYCGENRDFDAVRWLENGGIVKSVALIPLKSASHPEVFGLLVLGSENPQRFVSSMATDFLTDIGETASAALSCLLT